MLFNHRAIIRRAKKVWLIPSLVEEAKINLAVRNREVFQRIQNIGLYKKKKIPLKISY